MMEEFSLIQDLLATEIIQVPVQQLELKKIQDLLSVTIATITSLIQVCMALGKQAMAEDKKHQDCRHNKLKNQPSSTDIAATNSQTHTIMNTFLFSIIAVMVSM